MGESEHSRPADAARPRARQPGPAPRRTPGRPCTQAAPATCQRTCGQSSQSFRSRSSWLAGVSATPVPGGSAWPTDKPGETRACLTPTRAVPRITRGHLLLARTRGQTSELCVRAGDPVISLVKPTANIKHNTKLAGSANFAGSGLTSESI